jgi:hypothetical protein
MSLPTWEDITSEDIRLKPYPKKLRAAWERFDSCRFAYQDKENKYDNLDNLVGAYEALTYLYQAEVEYREVKAEGKRLKALKPKKVKVERKPVVLTVATKYLYELRDLLCVFKGMNASEYVDIHGVIVQVKLLKAALTINKNDSISSITVVTYDYETEKHVSKTLHEKGHYRYQVVNNEPFTHNAHVDNWLIIRAEHNAMRFLNQGVQQKMTHSLTFGGS